MNLNKSKQNNRYGQNETYSAKMTGYKNGMNLVIPWPKISFKYPKFEIPNGGHV